MALRGRFTDVTPRADRLLDTNGDGTGTKNANVDGSVTPVVFKCSPPATGAVVIERIMINVRDSGTFTAEKYGALAELTNGIEVGIFSDSDDSLVTDYLDGVPIKSNAGWGRACYDVDVKTWGAGDSFLLMRWTLSKSGTRLILRDSDNYSFGIKVNDDLTGLVEHYFTCQGFSTE